VISIVSIRTNGVSTGQLGSPLVLIILICNTACVFGRLNVTLQWRQLAHFSLFRYNYLLWYSYFLPHFGKLEFFQVVEMVVFYHLVPVASKIQWYVYDIVKLMLQVE